MRRERGAPTSHAPRRRCRQTFRAPRRRRRQTPHAPRRRGAILIETLIALALLGLMSAGMVSLLAQTLRTVHDVRPREREIENAAAALSLSSGWSRADLDAHLGTTRFGAVAVAIRPVAPSLYDVVALDSLGQRELLRTTLYRPSQP